MANNLVNFLFYVDPETNLVDGLYGFSPFGMVVRRDSDWFGISRKDSDIDQKTGHRFYTLDWDKVPLPDDNVDIYDPEAVLLYDKGGLTEKVLKDYATLAYDGTDTTEVREDEEPA
jgi:hypothetical protein